MATVVSLLDFGLVFLVKLSSLENDDEDISIVDIDGVGMIMFVMGKIKNGINSLRNGSPAPSNHHIVERPVHLQNRNY